MNNTTINTSADNNRVVTSSSNMSSSNHNTTRVFLRVKRRRPTSKTTSHDIANSTNNNNSNNTSNNISSGPDRIQLTLPCISSSTDNDEHHDGGGRNKKRRKMNQLVQRLDSAVSLHDKSAEELQKLDREYANLKAKSNSNTSSSLGLGSSSGGGGDLAQTPARRGASQNIDNSLNKMLPQDPPFSNNLSANSTNLSANTADNTADMNDMKDDNIPAPPTKPKRTVTFRKITNLQKQLALVDPCNPDNAGLMTGTERGKLYIQNKERESSRDLLALNNSSKSCCWSASNEDGQEKKSKWLRIVDVMLKEEEESDGSDDNNTAAAGDEDKSMGGEGSNVMSSGDNNKSTIAKVIIQGSGQRIRRMRPRPTDNEEEEEKKCDDDVVNNSSSGRQKKRRKLGKWVVEQSRNVLESDFTMESANTSSFTHQSSMCGANNNTNNNNSMNINNTMNNSMNNSHGLSPETIKLIDYSLQSINNQTTGTVSPHLAFLLHDPRLDGKGKLFVDYQLGSISDMGSGGGGEEGMASGSIGGREEEDTDGKGRTILHMAALYGDLTSIRTLLTTFNANPTIKDSQGNTPSMLARQGLNSMAYSISSPDSVARRNSYNVIEALIEGKVQSWKEKNQQQSTTSMAASSALLPKTAATQPPTQLDAQTVQVLNYSLSSIQKQNGGSILHYLTFLKSDHQLQYNTNTERDKLIVNHTFLPSHELIPEVDVRNSHIVGKGRTILHYAALYGDFIGVTTLLNDMGANPTIHDDDGNTPAMLGGYKAVVDVLKEGEKRWNASTKDGKDDDDGEYYYEVYCLEETTEMTDGDSKQASSKPKSQFLRPSSANSDSIPGLELSSALSEEDEDNDTLSSRGGNKQDCALIELQQGFGYWNEKGELVLEGDGKKSGEVADDDDRFVQKFYHNGDTMNGDDSMGNEEEHDSNDEGYDGNDYPDDDSDYMNDYNEDGYGGCYSDDDSVDNWRLDFRNRYVSREALNQFDSGGDGDSY